MDSFGHPEYVQPALIGNGLATASIAARDGGGDESFVYSNIHRAGRDPFEDSYA